MKKLLHQNDRVSSRSTRDWKRTTHTVSSKRVNITGASIAAKMSSGELRDHARWMHFHEIALMPARRLGGEIEVRRVLKQARSDGLTSMTDAQIEQEVRDVMAAPDM